jgi:hypothetical protein
VLFVPIPAPIIHLESTVQYLYRWLRTKGSGVRISPGAPDFYNKKRLRMNRYRSGLRLGREADEGLRLRIPIRKHTVRQAAAGAFCMYFQKRL